MKTYTIKTTHTDSQGEAGEMLFDIKAKTIKNAKNRAIKAAQNRYCLNVKSVKFVGYSF